jgi:hypothetical protein
MLPGVIQPTPHLVENVKMVLDVIERTVLSGSLCK